MKYEVKFKAENEGNWCSQCASRTYGSREEAQAAIDSDPTAGPDCYGAMVDVWIERCDET